MYTQEYFKEKRRNDLVSSLIDKGFTTETCLNQIIVSEILPVFAPIIGKNKTFAFAFKNG